MALQGPVLHDCGMHWRQEFLHVSLQAPDLLEHSLLHCCGLPLLTQSAWQLESAAAHWSRQAEACEPQPEQV